MGKFRAGLIHKFEGYKQRQEFTKSSDCSGEGLTNRVCIRRKVLPFKVLDYFFFFWHRGWFLVSYKFIFY